MFICMANSRHLRCGGFRVDDVLLKSYETLGTLGKQLVRKEEKNIF
jgi:hypothetical protein